MRLRTIIQKEVFNSYSPEDADIGKIEAYTEILSFIDSTQEEPKECMYSKDNYTDEDRKVLCDGCEEECNITGKSKECIENVKKSRQSDLALWSLEDFENSFFEIVKPYKDSHNYKNLCTRLCMWQCELWRWLHWKKSKEDPVSEDLEEVAKYYIPSESYHMTIESEGEGSCENVYDYTQMVEMFKAGMEKMKEQMIKDAKCGVGNNDNYIQFEDGTWVDLDPSLLMKPAFCVKEGEKVKVIFIKEE